MSDVTQILERLKAIEDKIDRFIEKTVRLETQMAFIKTSLATTLIPLALIAIKYFFFKG